MAGERARKTAAHLSTAKLVELVHEVDKKHAMHATIADGRLLLGTDPLQPTHVVDFFLESVTPYRNGHAVKGSGGAVDPSVAMPEFAIRHARRSGDYRISLHAQVKDCNSLKEALGEGLRRIESNRPGMLEKLSHIRPRSKCVVAREAAGLFNDASLCKKYAVPLVHGWWYGTNNSADETRKWLERACFCAGLEWGRDFSVDW